MSHIRRAPALGCSSLLLALVLTACGGGGGGGGGSTPTATPSGTTGSTTTPTTTTGGTSTTTPGTSTDTGTGTSGSAGSGTSTGTGSTGTGTSVTCAPGDVPATRATSFLLVNVVRAAMQLPSFARLAPLDGTAQAHAQYVVANGSGGSNETAGMPCSTGDTLNQCIAAAGVVEINAAGTRASTESVFTYDAPSGSELQPVDVINSALDNVYGRILLLNPVAQYIGVGFSAKPGGQQRAMVLDTTLTSDGAATVAAGTASWVVWPRDGAIGLPARMVSFNLKPLDASLTEGYPVSVHAAMPIKVTRFVMTEATSGAVVAATLITGDTDRNKFLGQGEAALVPNAPLTSGATYRVEFEGTIGTQAVSKTWTFAVR